jgi:hypothetical protein
MAVAVTRLATAAVLISTNKDPNDLSQRPDSNIVQLTCCRHSILLWSCSYGNILHNCEHGSKYTERMKTRADWLNSSDVISPYLLLLRFTFKDNWRTFCIAHCLEYSSNLWTDNWIYWTDMKCNYRHNYTIFTGLHVTQIIVVQHT